MSIKKKFSRAQKSDQDRAETRKMLLITVGITALLMVLMYFAFVR